jgi:hypothetical protein
MILGSLVAAMLLVVIVVSQLGVAPGGGANLPSNEVARLAHKAALGPGTDEELRARGVPPPDSTDGRSYFYHRMDMPFHWVACGSWVTSHMSGWVAEVNAGEVIIRSQTVDDSGKVIPQEFDEQVLNAGDELFVHGECGTYAVGRIAEIRAFGAGIGVIKFDTYDEPRWAVSGNPTRRDVPDAADLAALEEIDAIVAQIKEEYSGTRDARGAWHLPNGQPEYVAAGQTINPWVGDLSFRLPDGLMSFRFRDTPEGKVPYLDISSFNDQPGKQDCTMTPDGGPATFAYRCDGRLLFRFTRNPDGTVAVEIGEHHAHAIIWPGSHP